MLSTCQKRWSEECGAADNEKQGGRNGEGRGAVMEEEGEFEEFEKFEEEEEEEEKFLPMGGKEDRTGFLCLQQVDGENKKTGRREESRMVMVMRMRSRKMKMKGGWRRRWTRMSRRRRII
eukprot:401840-Hanusia_phi.AAC.1